MTNPNPRDVQVLPIATNTTVLRARSWTRLRFEIEYALARGTTSNSYVISGDKVAVIDPPPETFSLIYLDALRQCLNDWERLDYVVLGHFNPNRVATIKALLDLVPKLTFVCSLPCAANLRAAFPNRELKIISMLCSNYEQHYYSNSRSRLGKTASNSLSSWYINRRISANGC